jgi:hypothetical protein
MSVSFESMSVSFESMSVSSESILVNASTTCWLAPSVLVASSKAPPTCCERPLSALDSDEIAPEAMSRQALYAG